MERISIEETTDCAAYEDWADFCRDTLPCHDTIPCPPPSATDEDTDEVLDANLGDLPY